MSPASALRAPLLWLLLPFMAGLSLARYWMPGGRETLLLAAAGAFGIALAACPRRASWSLGVIIAAGTAGCLWLPLRSPTVAGWDESAPREVSVEIEIEQVFAGSVGRTAGGIATVTGAGSDSQELVGQRVYYSVIRKVSVTAVTSGNYALRGVARQLPDDPAAAGFEAYLANMGVRFEIARGILAHETAPPTAFNRFCAMAQQKLARILQLGIEAHPTAVSLYLGMLLGQKADLTDAQEQAFMQTGVFHVFSISGLHVGVIALAIQAALQLVRVPRRAAQAVALPVLWIYVQISGGSTPAERAFLMIAFLSGAKITRLPSNPLASLTAAALITLLIDPRQLFTAGFQMSYGVVTALVVMGMPLGARCKAWWQPWRSLPEADWKFHHRLILDAGQRLLVGLAVSGVALLASIPSGIGYFEMISPGSIVANLIVIPLSGLAIVAGFLSLLFGLCGFDAGSVLINHGAAVVIYLMDWLVQKGAPLPGMFFAANFREPWMAFPALGFVLAAMLAGAAFRWEKRVGGFWLPVGVVAVLLAACVVYP